LVQSAPPRRQHLLGPYILDFYCASALVAVELDGGQHLEPENQRHDEARTRYLEARGLCLLRFTNLQALKETQAVLEVILAALGTPLPKGARRSEADHALDGSASS
jgi:very-short-patch-repair endonuclease